MKKLLLLLLFLLPLSLTACSSDNIIPPVSYSVTIPPVAATVEIQKPAIKEKTYQASTPASTVAAAPELSNDNSYINSAGNVVHSPAYAPSVPSGATAICGDGTYSFSQSRRGTCSHHGGVGEWLN